MSRFFARESLPANADVANGSAQQESPVDLCPAVVKGLESPTVPMLSSHGSMSETRSMSDTRSISDTQAMSDNHNRLETQVLTDALSTAEEIASYSTKAFASIAIGPSGGNAIGHAEALIATPLPIAEGAQTHSRHDAITGRWTIFASGRDDRPNDFVTAPPSENVAIECPFCYGREDQTPASVLEIDEAECEAMTLGEWRKHSDQVGTQKPWAIRVIPNKFPAVDEMQGFDQRNLPDPAALSSAEKLRASKSRRDDPAQSLFRSRLVAGGHEVFIESPAHDQSLLTLDLSQVVMLFRAYQMRLAHWRKMPSICYVSLFKNSGPAAGASLHHSHSQLIATTDLPFAAKAVADRMKLHWAKTGCCLQCDMVRAEVKAKVRMVATTNSLVAYCPFGSHLPMLLRITTKRHLDCFESLSMDELEELARLVRRSIHWLQTVYPDVAYNYLIHTRPPGVGGEEMSHWALEIFPRVTQLAGFEWSSDCMINPMLPEVAAAKYRAIARDENPLR